MKTEGLAVPVRLLEWSAEATRLQLTWLAWGKGRTHVRGAVVGVHAMRPVRAECDKKLGDGVGGGGGLGDASLSPER